MSAKCSKAYIAKVNEYNRNNYDRILVVLPVGMKEKVRESATAQGKSMNAFIKRAIEKEISEMEKLI